MERIHVAVRARPLSTEDAGSSPWRIAGNAIALSAQASTRFEFDRIFGEECRTADVYGARTKHIVDSAVRGFNGTVFAYGQTNSGKTYTMRGSANEPGIIPLAVHDLFQSIQENIESCRFMKVLSRETCEESELLVEKGRNIDNAVDENELQKQLLIIMEERDRLLSEMKQMSLVINESEVLKENYCKKLIQAKANINELSSRISIMEVKMKNDASTFNKEKTKLRMQIHCMQPELDAHRGRLKEAMNEMKLMDAKYHEASTKLKKDLSYYCREVLRLREGLKESQGTSS